MNWKSLRSTFGNILLLIWELIKAWQDSSPTPQPKPPVDLPGFEPRPPILPPGPLPPIDNPGTVSEELLRLHNRLRQSEGEQPLRIDREVTILAQRQANYLAANNIWNDLHGRPAGGSLTKDIKELTFPVLSWGENAAAGQRNAYEAYEAWRKSHGHRRNMVRDTFLRVGFGHAVSKRGHDYWVAIFVG